MRILIVDNQVLFREGLISILNRVDGFEIVGEADTVESAVDKVLHFNPDLVLIDIFLPDGSGLEAMKALLAKKPNIKFIILTQHESDDLLLSAIRTGAIGYIIKSTPASSLITTLRAIERGEAAITRTMTLKVLEEFHRLGAIGEDNQSDLPALTDREKEVLSLLKEELTNQQISERLVISVNTVKVHVHNIMDKLNAKNRQMAADIARRYKI